MLGFCKPSMYRDSSFEVEESERSIRLSALSDGDVIEWASYHASRRQKVRVEKSLPQPVEVVRCRTRTTIHQEKHQPTQPGLLVPKSADYCKAGNRLFPRENTASYSTTRNLIPSVSHNLTERQTDRLVPKLQSPGCLSGIGSQRMTDNSRQQSLRFPRPSLTTSLRLHHHVAFPVNSGEMTSPLSK